MTALISQDLEKQPYTSSEYVLPLPPSPPSQKFISTENDLSSSPSPSDPNLITWSSPTDPSNPRNWPTRKKITNTLLIILLTLLTPLASSMFAPAIPQVLSEFHHSPSSSTIISELVVSIYILGFAVGPLVISPLSELHGRYPLYVVCNLMFLVFNVACALSASVTQLIIFRFLAGAAGVCPVALGGASIADLMAQERRGGAMALFAMGPLLGESIEKKGLDGRGEADLRRIGPVIGPVCGAYLSASVSWRWNFWVLAIAGGVFSIAHMLFCRETYAPVLLARKAAKLRKETGNPDLRSVLQPKMTKREHVLRAMVRPFKMLFLQPMIFFVALYVAFNFGILYLLFTTSTFVFENNYHFSQGNVGLTYLGAGAGMFIGLFTNGFLSDKILKAKAAKHEGKLQPEYRLIFLIYAAPLSPIGLFIYGWSAEYRIQWAVPLFGTLLFGVSLIAALMCIQQYLIDAYTVYAASAIAANTVMRSIVAGLLPLSGLSLYDKLGLGWGNSIIAFIALGLVPIPIIFYHFGERIRRMGTVDF